MEKGQESHGVAFSACRRTDGTCHRPSRQRRPPGLGSLPRWPVQARHGGAASGRPCPSGRQAPRPPTAHHDCGRRRPASGCCRAASVPRSRHRTAGFPDDEAPQRPSERRPSAHLQTTELPRTQSRRRGHLSSPIAGGFRLDFTGVHADMRTLVGVTSMWNSRPSRWASRASVASVGDRSPLSSRAT